MVKLTPDLLDSCRQYINPVRERELDLRGYKIPAVENLGAAYDQFDSIDFSDNDLKKLENFPLMLRLKYLYLNNNRIWFIDAKINETLPNLSTVILTNNNIQELGDIDSLSACSKLEHLSLLGNPVTHKPQYRFYVIYKLSHLRVLDFKRVKMQERKAASDMFGGKKGESLRQQLVKTSKTFNIGELAENGAKATNGTATNAVTVRSAEELRSIQNAIANAKTLENVNRLQQVLQAGQIPGLSNEAIQSLEEEAMEQEEQ